MISNHFDKNGQDAHKDAGVFALTVLSKDLAYQIFDLCDSLENVNDIDSQTFYLNRHAVKERVNKLCSSSLALIKIIRAYQLMEARHE